MKRFGIVIAVVALVASVSACRGPGSLFGTKKPSTDSSITIAASFYPIAEIVQRVGGDTVRVVNLTPPGTDAHEVELTAKQLQGLQDAKIAFYLGNLSPDGRISSHFQPTIEKALSNYTGQIVDLMNDLPIMIPLCGGCKLSVDPHVWLDPKYMILMTQRVQRSLSEARPDLAGTFSINAQSYIAELADVGAAIDTSFLKCDSKLVVTSHRAFQYFAIRAGLDLRPLTGVNPDAQISAKQLEKITRELRAQKVTTIFSEELVASSVVNTMAKDLNARVDVLQPLEGITNSDLKLGKNYISEQRENIARIAKGLRCS